MKIALITGINGQDGAYLAKFLVSKGYKVHGVMRRSSVNTTERIWKILGNNPSIELHYGDLTDTTSIIRIISAVKPDELYNLAAQSHVAISFESPEYTANADALGTLRILEAIRILKLEKTIKFYQASTSELYGKVQSIPQNENTPFYPRSPYAVAKLYSYWITVNYRESYKIFACNGILFNHESPIRGENFVTRKITLGVARIYHGEKQPIALGNLDAKRDWGHAADYVEAMWKMLQLDSPQDVVIATGKTFTVREFVEKAFKTINIDVDWRNAGLSEVGVNKTSGEELVVVDPKYYRPAEVDLLLGDASKAKKILNWESNIPIDKLIEEMVFSDIEKYKNRSTIVLN